MTGSSAVFLNPDEVGLIVRTYLGREVSARAVRELEHKHPLDILCGILLGDEFLGVVDAWSAGKSQLPQVRRRMSISPAFFEIARKHNLLERPALSRIRLKPTWHALISSTLACDSVLARIEDFFPLHRNLRRFCELRSQLGAKATSLPSLKPELSRTAFSPHPQLDQTSGRGQEIDCLTAILERGDVAGFHSVVDKIYKAKDWGTLTRVYARYGGNSPSLNDEVRFIASLYFARHLLARNACGTANAILEGMEAISPRGDFGNHGLLKLYRSLLSQSRSRSGRVDAALALHESRLATDPSDPDDLFQSAVLRRHQNPHLAAARFWKLLASSDERPVGWHLMAADFFMRNGTFEEAFRALSPVFPKAVEHPDVELSFASLAALSGDTMCWAGHLRSYFARFALSVSMFNLDEVGLPSPRTSSHPPRGQSPLVSVIMTAFNAVDTIRLAAESVLAQSVVDLELIIIDDASYDGTWERISDLASRDSRVIALHQDTNTGTYLAKNFGISRARGTYITFHDSDDWWHPQHVELHVLAMTRGEVVASTSKWARMSAAGVFQIRGGGSYLHDNPASTFVRREIFDEIGRFDTVRVGADSELLWRLITRYGHARVLSIELPLAIGLDHDRSLTTSGVAAFDEHRFSPVRAKYWESWVRWHLSSVLEEFQLRMPEASNDRPFVAPAEIV
ncbi:glycosyltransferase [Enterovirga sp. CN4-39]|uniref:glycosyltransferase n=1 Tax=Enterovirga sp. CN4-39 TaxID=3400910 RepID=UPI003C021752